LESLSLIVNVPLPRKTAKTPAIGRPLLYQTLPACPAVFQLFLKASVWRLKDRSSTIDPPAMPPVR